MAECERERPESYTITETKVKPFPLNQITFCSDRGTKRQTPLKGKAFY